MYTGAMLTESVHTIVDVEPTQGPKLPAVHVEGRLPKIISLFSGAGGLDLGFKQAGYSIALAIDSSAAAIKTHKRNFRRTKSVVADLEKIGPEGVLSHVLSSVPIGSRIGVIGGPPCQGFSRANNASLRTDPRNRLPDLYIRVVEILQQHYIVDFVVFENVLGIRDKKHAPTYQALVKNLRLRGFHVSEDELCALDYGVPQIRRRVILTGVRQAANSNAIKFRKRTGPSTVREVLTGIPDPIFYERGLTENDIPVHPNHWTMMPRSARFKSKGGTTSDGRSFKRLRWDEPSPTVAYGNREIHVHPNGRRRLSVHEALILQGFPLNFVLEGNFSEQVTQVSNAVPPPLGKTIALAIRRHMGYL